jgi:hypothetical protein
LNTDEGVLKSRWSRFEKQRISVECRWSSVESDEAVMNADEAVSNADEAVSNADEAVSNADEAVSNADEAVLNCRWSSVVKKSWKVQQISLFRLQYAVSSYNSYNATNHQLFMFFLHYILLDHLLGEFVRGSLHWAFDHNVCKNCDSNKM